MHHSLMWALGELQFLIGSTDIPGYPNPDNLAGFGVFPEYICFDEHH